MSLLAEAGHRWPTNCPFHNQIPTHILQQKQHPPPAHLSDKDDSSVGKRSPLTPQHWFLGECYWLESSLPRHPSMLGGGPSIPPLLCYRSIWNIVWIEPKEQRHLGHDLHPILFGNSFVQEPRHISTPFHQGYFVLDLLFLVLLKCF